MLIDLTYRCNMGCNHCMSDCKPNGTDMTPEILKDVLAFCKKNEVPNLIFSGGELFEKRYILELLKIIEVECANYKIQEENCQSNCKKYLSRWPILKVGHIRYQVIMFERVN